MRFYEATKKDLPRLLPFIRRELAAWGYEPKTTLDGLERTRRTHRRYAWVEEDGVIAAVLAVHPWKTDEGPAYEICLWVVAFDHPRKLEVFHALALWGCNLLRSEGIRIVFSHRDMTRPTFDAAGHLGMTVVDEGRGEEPNDLLQRGDTEAIISYILSRRPKWRLL